MLKIYTSQNYTQVELVKGEIEDQGIACIMRNQFTALASGEIPATYTWPELWLVNDTDRDAALAVLSAREKSSAAPQADWTCPHCGESNEGQFSACWRCSQERVVPA